MKRTRQKHPRQYRKYRAGCMWGILSMLDFRRRSNQRFLSGDLGNRLELLASLDEKLPTALVGKEKFSVKAITKPSVKTLIEEEIGGKQDHKVTKGCAKSAPGQSDKEVKDDIKRSRKRNRRSPEGSCNLEFESLNGYKGCAVYESSDKHNRKEITDQIWGEIFQGSMLIGKYDGCPDSGDSRISDIRKKLGETIGEFVNQQIACGKRLGEDRSIVFSKELVNVLQVPNLDEESFLKHQRDPNSLLVKYMQSLQDANVEGDEISDLKPELDKPKGNEALLNGNCGSIGRNVDPQEKNGIQLSLNSSLRITSLKPRPTEMGRPSTTGSLDSSSPLSPQVARSNEKYKGNAPFSVASIKRMLKGTLGREQSGVNPDGVTKIGDHWGRDEANVGNNPGRNSPGKEQFYLEKMVKHPSGTKRQEKFVKPNKLGMLIQRDDDMNGSKRREANIYLEAKKHLAEMLSTTDEFKKFSSRQFPKSLGRILSLPDYSSPLASPGTDFDRRFAASQMRFSFKDRPHQAVGETIVSRRDEDSDSQLLLSMDSTDDESIILEKFNANVQAHQGTADIASEEVGNADIEVAVSYDSLTDDQNNPCTTRYDEGLIEEHDFRYGLASTLSTSPQGSSTMKKEEDFEMVINKLERPSPVSVLDPSLVEDDLSLSEISSRAVEIQIKPLQIKFEDEMPTPLSNTQPEVGLDDNSLVLEYVKVALQAFRFNWSEHYLRSEHSDQLIDASLFDGLYFLFDHLQHDQKLMVDCINEVLLEVCDDYFGCCPWVAFVKHGIRHMLNWESSVSEVWEGVRWHLLPLPVPCTLDHAVTKDMAKTGKWMDLCCDTEVIGFDMEEAIFKGLIEETILISLGFADISKTEDFD